MKNTLCACLLFITCTLSAQTVTWDGGAGTHNWEDALNWDTDLIPGPSENVVIIEDSVVINTSTGVKSITLGDSATGITGVQLFLKLNQNLNIYNSDDKGILLDSEYATFYNRGSIVFDFCQGTALSISQGDFRNLPLSEVSVINCLAGISITGNAATFKVSSSAKVSITNVTGLSIKLNSGGSLFNEGLIEISYSGEARLDATVDNYGTIYINEPLNYAIKVNSSFSEPVTNYGTIKIDNADSGISFSEGSIVNTICGKIYTSGTLLIQSDIFYNYGLMTRSYSGYNQNFSGNLRNEGVLIDQGNVHPYNSQLINVGSLVKGIRGDLTVGKKEIVVHKGTGLNPIIADKWYSDKNKTTFAGTYDETDGSFTPNSVAINADSLFFDVLNGACPQLAYILITSKPKCTAVTSTSTFTQSVSTAWHNPLNWANGIVPDQCLKALVPNLTLCDIATNTKARAFSIECETGSVFSTEEGVVLDINPN